MRPVSSGEFWLALASESTTKGLAEAREGAKAAARNAAASRDLSNITRNSGFRRKPSNHRTNGGEPGFGAKKELTIRKFVIMENIGSALFPACLGWRGVCIDSPMTGIDSAIRLYSRHEHLADVVIHLLGVAFAVSATAWLLSHVSGFVTVAAVSVYCAGLLAMIIASAAYNLAPTGTLKEILRRFDHSAIFVMIAATYTPFAAARLGYPVGDVILSLVWSAAAFGVGLKMLFPRRFEKVSVVLYLA